MKKLGVVGGLGPAASAYFYELLTGLSAAETDQEHPEIIIYSRTSVPDRTAYILGRSDESPVPLITDTINALETIGAEIIAIPCVTACYFYDELVKAAGIPVINMIKEAADELERRGISSAGIMGTSGTLKSQMFQQELEKRGIKTIVPSERNRETVMNVIYEIKANKQIDFEAFEAVSAELTNAGAQTIILGCTELSLINRSRKLGERYTDAMEVLAVSALRACGARA